MSDSQFNHLFDEFLNKLEGAAPQTREAGFRLVQGHLTEVLQLVEQHEQKAKDVADKLRKQQEAAVLEQPGPQPPTQRVESAPVTSNLSQVP